MSKNTGGPAFPSPGVVLSDGRQQGAYEGMALRDFFAAHAITGAAASIPQCSDDVAAMRMTAAVAYGIADAMLAERAK